MRYKDAIRRPAAPFNSIGATAYARASPGAWRAHQRTARGGRPTGASPVKWIPRIVVTAKDLTEEDRRRLNGYVESILQKGAYEAEELLRGVCDAVKVRVQSRQANIGEAYS